MLELQTVVLKPGARPISHRFESGRISVVLGRNQSGKTLLTRVVAGLTEPVSGELLLDGESITTAPPGVRSVSLVYQAFVNYPDWTVFENLASPLRARQRKQRRAEREDSAVRETVESLADKLGLTELLARYPHSLSGGQQQRLAIGRALAKSARVLVMDEPLVNLDYKLREALQLELRSLLHEFGVSVIYTSSDPRDAFALGDDLLLMADHGVIQTGTPLEIDRAPASPAAVDLMSDPRANRWRDAGALHLVRPEHLFLEREAADDVAFDVAVLGSETNGSETFLHCQARGEAHWVARLDGLVEAREGERQTLYAPAANVLSFRD
jgi:glycerol transport system ATP-binding protein